MKNITLNENGQGVTIHTPHGQVVVRVYGGERFNMNETKITVVGDMDGKHFMQVGDSATPIVFPERMFGDVGNVYQVRLRHRGLIQMKEMGDPKEPTPLGVVAMRYLQAEKEKKK